MRKKERIEGSVLITAYVDHPDECPICKHAIAPEVLFSTDYENYKNDLFAAYLFKCTSCLKPFVGFYSLPTPTAASIYESELIWCEPNKYVQIDFKEEIQMVSPNFIKIYNQSLAAETSGLDEIAGMGYRKAIEFLIKDYLIQKFPNDKEKLLEMSLSNCISNKVTHEDLKIVATRCNWLGSDFAHYQQKYEEYDIDTLKKFIDAVVYWISMEKATELALAIENRK